MQNNTELLNETSAQFQFKEERQALEDTALLNDNFFVIDKQALESSILGLPLHEIMDVPESWLDENNLDATNWELDSDSDDGSGLDYIGFCNIVPQIFRTEISDEFIEKTTQGQMHNHHPEKTADASINRTPLEKEISQKDFEQSRKTKEPPKSEKEELESWLDDVLG